MTDSKASAEAISLSAPLDSLPMEILNLIVLHLPVISQISFKRTSKRNLEAGPSLVELTSQRQGRIEKFLLRHYISPPRPPAPDANRLICSACWQYHDPKCFTASQKRMPSEERRCIGSTGVVWVTPSSYLESRDGIDEISPRGFLFLESKTDLESQLLCTHETTLAWNPMRIWRVLRISKLVATKFRQIWKFLLGEICDDKGALDVIRDILKDIDFSICPHSRLSCGFGLAEQLLQMLNLRVKAFPLRGQGLPESDHSDAESYGKSPYRPLVDYTYLLTQSSYLEKFPHIDTCSLECCGCKKCDISVSVKLDFYCEADLLRESAPLISSIPNHQIYLTLEIRTTLEDENGKVASGNWISQMVPDGQLEREKGWVLRGVKRPRGE